MLAMSKFDMILCMDWLVVKRAVLDCFNKTVSLESANRSVEFVGAKKLTSTRLISTLKADRLMSGCEGYNAFITEDKKLKSLEEILVVCEFPNMFQDEVSGLPLMREIKFTIELLLGTTPILKAPYRTAPTKLKELRTLSEELLDKGFIRPSVSPWELQYYL